MKDNTQKILSMILVLALVAGCFVTLVTPTAKAAKAPGATDYPSLVALLAGESPTGIEFRVDAVSGNSLNAPILLWWDYHDDIKLGDVWMLIASSPDMKWTDDAMLGTTKCKVLAYAPDTLNGKGVAYSLIKFTNVWLTGTDKLDISMESGLNNPGQGIHGNVNDFFPQLVTIKYWDRGTLLQPAVIVREDDVVIIRDCEEINTGYKFSHWVDGNNNTRIAKSQFLIPRGIKEINLYAVWIPDYNQTNRLNYTVAYFVNGTSSVGSDVFFGDVWVNDPQVLAVAS
ncbi:MAG: hypothetical protein LBI79_02655, partial [Nitrososphaerota archaeon]|nr:hypothetical protein [Nitrososphaerota archaeon]